MSDIRAQSQSNGDDRSHGDDDEEQEEPLRYVPRLRQSYQIQQRGTPFYKAIHFYIDREIGAGAPKLTTAWAMIKKNPFIPIGVIGGLAGANYNLYYVFAGQGGYRPAVFFKLACVGMGFVSLLSQDYYYEKKYEREFGHPWHGMDNKLILQYNVPESEIIMETWASKQQRKKAGHVAPVNAAFPYQIDREMRSEQFDSDEIVDDSSS